MDKRKKKQAIAKKYENKDGAWTVSTFFTDDATVQKEQAKRDAEAKRTSEFYAKCLTRREKQLDAIITLLKTIAKKL